MIEILSISIFGAAALFGAFHKKAGYSALAVASSIFLAFFVINRTFIGDFSIIASSVWIIVAVYSLRYGENYGRWLSSMLPLMIMGMSLILTSTNYLVLLSGWEIMSVPAYLIIALNRREHTPAFVFMAFSELSTVLIIIGSTYAYYLTGTLQFNSISSSVPLFIISIGALVKMGMSPFMISEWLPIAHGNAPANASAALSATMTLMGVFLIVRMLLLSPQNIYVGLVFLSIGALSILFASIYAYVSENLKMLAGFSTIDNNGAILCAAGLYLLVSSPVLGTFALYTVLVLSIAHSLGKTGLFLSIGNVRGEYFSMIGEKSSSWNNVGTFLSTLSLSGLFPTIGGLGVWMLLESFFMEAYSGGFAGITAIVVGSVIALGEGMASGAMLKILSFGSLFRKSRVRARNSSTGSVLAAGILTVFAFFIATYIVPNQYISGLPSVLVSNGYMIQSKFSAADFGLITPDYILLLVGIFSIVGYAVFRSPRTRTVPAWNSGLQVKQEYTSFAYSNNIKLMLRKLLRTKITGNGENVSVMDFFWALTIGTAGAYRSFCRKITLNFMNSSIGWYMVYMLAAFLGIFILFGLTSGSF